MKSKAGQMKAKILRIDEVNPDREKLKMAAHSLRNGRVIGFPTETVYGLGALGSYKKAVEKIFKLKERPSGRHLTLHLAEAEVAKKRKVFKQRLFNYLIDKFWPGPLTLIVREKNGKVTGFRLPDSKIARGIAELAGEAILATSANKSGEESPTNAESVIGEFGDKVDLIVDAGDTSYGMDSTIADLSGEEPKIVREGARLEDIRKAIDDYKKGNIPPANILVVCTGNSCRSPMAEGWVKKEIEKRGLKGKFDVASCGVATARGRRPTEEAVETAKEDGIDISGYRARVFKKELAEKADFIISMSDIHTRTILEACPSAANKIITLAVPDPIGCGIEEYKKAYRMIKKSLEKELEWILSW